jgi:hypothetical protein
VEWPARIAISGNDLFVASWGITGGETIAEYTASGSTVNASLVSVNFHSGLAVSGNYLFVEESTNIAEYTTSGSLVNGELISGLHTPIGIAISGTNLFVVNEGTGIVGEYTTSGATVNASLISGLGNPSFMAISGTNLFVANESGAIGKYGTNGAMINASLISGLNSLGLIAIWGNNLLVVESTNIAEYTTSGSLVNGELISGLYAPWGITISPAPQLSIATAGNQNVLFYPAWATNYVLQSVTNLNSTNWLTVTNGVQVIGVTNVAVTVTNNLPASFFRLLSAQ